MTLMTSCRQIMLLGVLVLMLPLPTHALEFEAGDTTLGFEGYVKLDLIHDFDADLGNVIEREDIRVEGEVDGDGHTRLHGYESRFGFTSSTPLGGSELEAMVEVDFMHGGGGGLRLRHAYVEWNGILAGQTWSNFGNDLSSFPAVDLNALVAQDNDRQPQLRYSVDGFSASLEHPRGTGTGRVGGDVAAQGTEETRYPDLTVRYENDDGRFGYAAAGVLRYLEYDAAGTDVDSTAWRDDTAIGWGATLEASLELTPRVTLRGSLTQGDGIGGYLYLNPADPGYVDGNGDLQTLQATGGGMNMSVEAGPGDVSFGYGIVKADLDTAFANGDVESTDTDEYQSAFINYIWSTRDNLSYGLEAGYHTRSQVDGRDGEAVRVQGMVKYEF